MCACVLLPKTLCRVDHKTIAACRYVNRVKCDQCIGIDVIVCRYIAFDGLWSNEIFSDVFSLAVKKVV